MRLRAIDVRNWACIEALSLEGLGDGIIVLHGPNRTGKSSLAEALRCCLFDVDHNNTNQRLTAALPRRTKGVPQITVEFEVAAKRYKIAKAFSRNKDGFARLEVANGTGWSVLEEGKQANQRVRELIGVEKSQSGLLQMLWLQQGEIRLPEKPDAALTKSLEAVLGSMITGRDIDFKKRLDKACERWFTPTMQDRKNSPGQLLGADLAEANERLQEIEKQWADAEGALRDYDEALARAPELKRALEETAAELERVQKECQGVRERKAQYDLALRGFQQCERLLRQADQHLQDHDEAVLQLAIATKSLDAMKLELRDADAKCVTADGEVAAARETAAQAEQHLAEHRRQRADFDDRQRLIGNRLECETLHEKIAAVERLEAERASLEQKLVGPAVLPESALKELRANREQAAKLRARLEAAEIHVTIQVKAPLSIEVRTDGSAATKVEVPPSDERRWLVRQSAEFQIGDQAVVRVGRGMEDRNLDELARELAELEQSVQATLAAAQLDGDDPTAIDQLVARRLRHEESTKQLQRLRGEIARAAPDGLPALSAQLGQKQAEKESIFTRRPELRDWTPDEVELNRLRSQFDSEEARLQACADEAKLAVDRLGDSFARAIQLCQELRTRVAGQTVQVQSIQERVGRDDRAGLVQERELAASRLAEARRKLDDSTLSDAEHALELQFESIRAAHANRAERLRQIENLLIELRTKLAGTEGLHQKRIQAEQTVNDRQRELERETLYAQAHKHLKAAFEEVRKEQVRRTVGPINDRVMQWAGQLGVTEYASLSFGAQLLPAGLAPAHAPDGEPVELERESYGTLEQLSLLIRLAVGGLLATNEPAVAILDDPLAHADPTKHRKMLDILARAAQGEPQGVHPTGPLQLIVLTCHAERFDYLKDAQQLDLARLIRRGG